jgi:hypothetical protein
MEVLFFLIAGLFLYYGSFDVLLGIDSMLDLIVEASDLHNLALRLL